MNIAIILFVKPILAIIFLVINNLNRYEKEIPNFISEKGIKNKIINKEKKDIIGSLIISIFNFFIIVIAILKYDPNIGNFQYQITIYGIILGG